MVFSSEVVSQKIKCLHLIETGGPGGAEKMLIQLVEDLRSRGVESTIILLKAGWLQEQLVNRKLDCRVIHWSGLIDVKWIVEVTRIIATSEIQIVHGHEFFMNCIASLLGVLSRVPCVSTVHGKNYYGERRRRVTAYKLVSLLSKMVAVSQNIRSYLVSLGMSNNRLHVIENGIDTKEFIFDDVVRHNSRANLGIRSEDLCILVVGNLYPVKGHEYLVDGIPKIIKACGETKILFAGRGESERQLVQQATELGILDAIHFLGFVDDVRSLLCACDVFVLPSLSEGLPLSVLEAMACERAVVATDVGGLGEVITHSISGLLVKPRSTDQLVSAITLLSHDRKLRTRMGLNARSVVESRHSLESTTRRYVQLYKSAMAR